MGASLITPVSSPLEASLYALYLSHLFEVNGFRKVYYDVPGYQIDHFDAVARGIFREEGRLEAHLWRDGRHWPLHIFAVEGRISLAGRREIDDLDPVSCRVDYV